MKSPEALKTIGEVAKIVNVPIYVLRFWEKNKFDSSNKKKMAQDTIIILK